MKFARILMIVFGLLALPAAATAWTATETVQHYRIEGQSAGALYGSIGKNGPKVGQTRAIALTTFKLTWRRNYVKQGQACVLESAIPRLVITYHLPQPRGKLAAPLDAQWTAFSDGILRHEKVHGTHIIEMVRAIEAATVGFRQENDPGCKAIRQAIQLPLKALSDQQRTRSREFDQLELTDGGAVHRLILEFLNSGR